MKVYIAYVCLIIGMAGVLMATSGAFDRPEPSSPKFTVGECIVFNGVREEWEKPSPVWKVMQVGKENYRVNYPNSSELDESYSKAFFLVDELYVKTKCPE